MNIFNLILYKYLTGNSNNKSEPVIIPIFI